MNEPAPQRAPPEIWERIARYIPRYQLRSWLSLSAFHREIAQRHIFHTLDLFFGECCFRVPVCQHDGTLCNLRSIVLDPTPKGRYRHCVLGSRI